jgi:ketosteroid isomerase-like protein
VSNAERLIAALEPVFSSEEIEVDAALVDRMVAAVAGLAADDVVCVMSGGENFEATYEGLEGLRAAWADWLEAFARIRFEIEEVQQVGENVITLGRQTGVTRHDEVEIVQPSAAVWKFADGVLFRIEFHLDREIAFESARAPAQRGDL